MRATIATGLVIFSLCLFAQQLATKEPPPIIWQQGKSNCDLIYQDGEPHEHFDDGKIVIDVFAPWQNKKDKHLYRVLVGVFNKGGTGNLDVDPARMGAEMSTGDLVYPTNGDAILDKSESHAIHHERLGAFFRGFGAGMAQPSGTITNPDGSTSQVHVNDSGPAQEAAAEGASERTGIRNYYASRREGVLRRNTLLPQGFATGDVYFELPKEADKNASVKAVLLQLGGRVYIFNWPPTGPDPE